MHITPEFDLAFRNLVHQWEQYESLRASEDLTARAEARYQLDQARWSAASARRSLYQRAA